MSDRSTTEELPSSVIQTATSGTMAGPGTLFGGCITTSLRSRGATTATRQFIFGNITTTTRGQIRGASELIIASSIQASVQISGDRLQLRTLLEGNITTESFTYFTPTEAVLSGLISIASFGYIPLLPILPEVEPPYCPIPAVLDDYLNLITSEHNQRPKYMQTVTSTVEPLVDDQGVVSGFPCLFDLDISAGEQEDYTGQWIGKTRFVHLGDVFFSWDVKGLGWDEANWRGPFDPPDSIARLDDYHYRLLLYATVVVNHWDGSIPTAYRAWDTLFAHTGYKVLIQDYGNMTMLLGLMGTGTIDAVTQALFQNGNMDLRPEGIELIDYVFQAQAGVPFFAWDSNSDSVAGWDIGYWGILVPPGQGFIPDALAVNTASGG